MGEINSHEVWQVRFSDIRVKSGTRTVARDFRVLMDATTGQLRDIYSVCDTVGSSDTLPEAMGDGFVLASDCPLLPDRLPLLNFMQILDSLRHPIASSKVIRAVYVPCDTQQAAQPATWIVIIRGRETPFPISTVRLAGRPAPDQPADRYLNSLLFVVDAATGRCIRFTDAPSARRN